MANTVKAIPEGFEGATPYLSIKGAADALEFYKKAFGATETVRMAGPDGRIGHAEIKIGKANIMLADEHPEISFLSPRTLGGSPVTIHIYVEDVDALAAQAEAAGAKVLRPVADRSEEHTSELQSLRHLVCRLLLEKKKSMCSSACAWDCSCFREVWPSPGPPAFTTQPDWNCWFNLLNHAVHLPHHPNFFFNDTATTEIYTLSLHDALPIWVNIVLGKNVDAGRLVAGFTFVEP